MAVGLPAAAVGLCLAVSAPALAQEGAAPRGASGAVITQPKEEPKPELKEPVLTHFVDPVYPKEALEQGLEAKVVLPLIRTSFRDVAETMTALQFVDSRSKVEAEASTRMRDELKKYFLNTDGVFVANIELDHSEAGKQLMRTQTDKVVALNEQQMYGEKKKAEVERALFVKAQEEAEQQRKVVQAAYEVQVKEQQAKAREAEAQGEARYITITAEARQQAYQAMASAIGADGVTRLETLKLISEGKINITPQVMVAGDGGSGDALAGTILGRLIPAQSAPAPAAPAPAPADGGKRR